jgi:hypothetical protein
MSEIRQTNKKFLSQLWKWKSDACFQYSKSTPSDLEAKSLDNHGILVPGAITETKSKVEIIPTMFPIEFLTKT